MRKRLCYEHHYHHCRTASIYMLYTVHYVIFLICPIPIIESSSILSDFCTYFVAKVCGKSVWCVNMFVWSDHLSSSREPNCNPSFSCSLNNHVQEVGILIVDPCRKVKVIIRSSFHRIHCIGGLREAQVVLFCYKPFTTNKTLYQHMQFYHCLNIPSSA